MSINVQRAVWESQREMDGLTKFVLLRLADFASDDGGNVYPSIGRVADDCRIGQRTVRNAFRALEGDGILIKVADEDAARHRPRQYRIDLKALATPGTTCRPAPDAARHDVPPSPAPYAGAPRHHVPPNHYKYPSYTHQGNSTDLPDGNAVVIALPAKTTVPTKSAKPSFPEEAFAEFWTVYPRHVDEDAARGAYREALKKGATPAGLIASASAYAVAVVQDETPTRFIKKPANFLRHGAWKDAPEQPSPHRPNGTRRQSVQDAADLVFADTPEAQRFREAFR